MVPADVIANRRMRALWFPQVTQRDVKEAKAGFPRRITFLRLTRLMRCRTLQGMREPGSLLALFYPADIYCGVIADGLHVDYYANIS